MSVRLRRLQRDYELLRREFDGHPAITVEPIAGNPPERYRVTYQVKGLMLDTGTKRPVETNHHVVEVYLHQSYPREKPKCLMLTPIFHPNITNWVCIGDHWAAGETLVDVLVQIGDMIQYRVYNPKSPLDPRAARWATENTELFPIDNVDFYQPDVAIELHFDDEAEQGPSDEDKEIRIEFH